MLEKGKKDDEKLIMHGGKYEGEVVVQRSTISNFRVLPRIQLLSLVGVDF